MATSFQSSRAIGAILLGSLLWGLTWLPIKHFGAVGLTGITLTLCTYGVIGALALPFIALRFQAWKSQSGLLLLAALFGGIANSTFVTALMNGNVTRSMLLFYLIPVWGVLGGRIFLGETVSRTRCLAVVLSIAGALLVLGGPQTLSGPLDGNDLLSLAAGFFYTAQNIAFRAADRIPATIKSMAVFAGCGVVAVAVLPLTSHSLPPINAALALQLAAFSFLWLSLAMLASTYGVSHLEAGRAAVLVVFELVTAVVSAMVVGGERLDAMGWIGAVLMVSAALLEARSAAAPTPHPTLLPAPARHD